MNARKSDFTKPDGLSFEQWLIRLESDKRDILAQIRREVHTRGCSHGKYLDRLNRAISFAKAEGRAS